MGRNSCSYFLLLVLALLSWSCKKSISQHKDTLFELISSDSSGIDFINKIETNDSVNILNYEYLYNGGGVGIGDFNNDSLPDIFFTANQVPSKLYLNKGTFKFEDITKKSGIDTKNAWAYGVCVVDINQDGWQDIYISAGGMGNQNIFPNKLYINQGDLTFVESSSVYGLADSTESIQSVFFDYDHDGDLDMYLLVGGGFEKSAIVARPLVKDGSGRNTDRLYRNDFDKKSGHPYFTNVSNEAGIVEEGFGLGVSLIDINEDGWLDVYVTNDYLSPDLLYVNNQNGTFSEKAAHYFKHTSHFAMGNDMGDINNDGHFDIIAVDMLPEDHYRRKLMFGPNQYDRFYSAVNLGCGYQYMRNTLQLNNGNGSFSEIGQFAGIYKTDWSWSALLADYDNDGYQDIFITNGFGKDITDLDFVKFRNEAPSLLDQTSLRKAFLDSLAIRPGIIKPNYAYKNNGDNTFSKKTREWGFDTPSLSNGAAYADLDRDGDVDLIINNIDDKAFIYKNTLREKATPNTHYTKIKLIGTDQNKSGIGSNITLKYSGHIQVRLQSTVRGFESSVENILHFGLGEFQNIDTIEVDWNDGRVSRLFNIKSDQTITISHKNSQPNNIQPKPVQQTLFSALSDKAVPYKHDERDFNDFNYQPLLPHKLSQQGPGIAVGDIDHDGLDDMYCSGSYHQPGYFLVQQKDGNFKSRPFSTEDDPCEDLGCLLFDADNDNDLDLYVVSGGNEYGIDHKYYQDRLYRNDGKGNFSKDVDALPKMLSSGSCVVAGDYDQDGDLDLFIGGRVVPGAYPTAPNSYVLENEKGKFKDVTEVIAPELKNIGMVTAALWTDFDNDNQLDLLVVGEAMPISAFKNQGGKFKTITTQSGLKDTDGFWNSLVAGDFDNDGDMDYVAGNLGVNAPYRASVQEPITIHYADFDNNGSTEPFIGSYEDGINYPMASLDELTKQVPILKKHILYYRNYASTPMEQLISITGKKDFKTLYCKTLQTAMIENLGNGTFKTKALPADAQLGPVNGMLAEDINHDGYLDLLAVGNAYGTEVVTGRYDALIGLTLLGDGKNSFKPLSMKTSGFFVDGDAKGIVRIETNKTESWIVVTQNNDSIKAFRMNRSRDRVILSNPKESFALLTLLKGNRRRVELSYGTTYLSQSSRNLLITPQVKSVEFFDRKGKSMRIVQNQK